MRPTLVLLALALGLPTVAGCSSDEVKSNPDVPAPAPQDSGAGKNQKQHLQPVGQGGRRIPGTK